MDAIQIDRDESKKTRKGESCLIDNQDDLKSVVGDDSAIRHPANRVNKKILHYLAKGIQNEKPDEYLKKLTTLTGKYAGVPDGNIVVFTGAGRALKSVVKESITYGDEILFCGPGPDFISDLATGVGARAIEYNSPSLFAPDPDGIIRNISSITKLIYLANPNFITGAVCNPGDIEYILSRIGKIKMIVDESLYEYCGISVTGLINDYDNLIILRTFSRAWELQGMVCDYLLTSRNTAASLRRDAVKKLSTITLIGAIAALAGFEEEKVRWNIIRENMTYLSTRLRSMGLACRPTPTDSLLVKVDHPRRSADRLRSAEIDAVSLHRYAGLENYISVQVGDDENSRNIICVIEKMPGISGRTGLTRKPRLILKQKKPGKLETADAANIDWQSGRELKDSELTTK